MLIVNTLVVIVLLVALALLSCPSLWALPMALLDARRGRHVHHRAEYRAAVTTHLTAIAIFALSIGFIVRTQLCRGCTSGIILLPLALLVPVVPWALHFSAQRGLQRAYRRAG